MKKIKVLCGAPTHECKKYCREDYIKTLEKIVIPENVEMDCMFVDNSKTRENFEWYKSKGFKTYRVNPKETIRETLAVCLNIFRDEVIEEGYDYFFSLEVDNFPPSDILETLLSFQEELKQGPVGAWYLIGDGLKRKPGLVGARDIPGKDRAETFALDKIQSDLFIDGNCKRIHAMGIGCVLIPRFILEQIVFRAKPDWPQAPDTWFYVDLHNLGIPVYVDTSTQVGHKDRAWTLEDMFKGCYDKIGKVH